jgi:hypothetical protein
VTDKLENSHKRAGDRLKIVAIKREKSDEKEKCLSKANKRKPNQGDN